MNKTLLIITTAGRICWLKKAIETLRDSLDVLVIDDATPDEIGIRSFCREKGLQFITKDKSMGLTDSWNRGYQFFENSSYQNCILSNDDVLFPKDFSIGIIEGLKQFDFVGPLTNNPGHRHQSEIFKFSNIKPTADNIDEIQQDISNRKQKFIQCKNLNGFCFAFSKSASRFKFSERLLFDPSNINIKNEDDLFMRVDKMNGKIAVCTISYVFHIKRGTFRYLKSKDRNSLWDEHNEN